MERDAFDGAFQRLVIDALARAGFRSSGKTAYLATPELTIALIRLGGRMALPGTAAHVLCFRHTVLRGVQDDAPNLTIPSDYVFKFRPSELQGSPPNTWRYRPQNLSFDYDRLDHRALPPDQVERTLSELARFVSDVFLPWAREMSPERVVSQLRAHGEDAWCERRWIADYLARPRGEA
jgi:hypothetical protein